MTSHAPVRQFRWEDTARKTFAKRAAHAVPTRKVVTATRRTDPVLPQAQVFLNFLVFEDEYNRRAQTHDPVYPLYAQTDVACFKGEYALARKEVAQNATGAIPQKYIVSSLNGFSQEDLDGLYAAGMVLTSGADQKDGTATVVAHGSQWAPNTGPDTLPAGYTIILDDPEVTKRGDRILPAYQSPDYGGRENTKFLPVTRPWKAESAGMIFSRLDRDVMEALSRIASDGGNSTAKCSRLRSITESAWRDRSIHRTNPEQCPLRRYHLYLTALLTKHGSEADVKEWFWDEDERMLDNFLACYDNRTAAGDLTSQRFGRQSSNGMHSSAIEHLGNVEWVAAMLQGSAPIESKHMIQILHFLSFRSRCEAAFTARVIQRAVGYAMQDIPAGGYGTIMLGHKRT